MELWRDQGLRGQQERHITELPRPTVMLYTLLNSPNFPNEPHRYALWLMAVPPRGALDSSDLFE